MNYEMMIAVDVFEFSSKNNRQDNPLLIGYTEYLTVALFQLTINARHITDCFLYRLDAVRAMYIGCHYRPFLMPMAAWLTSIF